MSVYYESEKVYKGAPRGSLIGYIGEDGGNIDKNTFTLVGSHWKGSFFSNEQLYKDGNGRLYLRFNTTQQASAPLWWDTKSGRYELPRHEGSLGWFDITVKVYPLPPIVVPPKPTLTPESIQTKITLPTASTGKNSDQYGWLWGLGVGTAFLVGLAWGIDRWKRKNPSQPGSTGGATGSTGAGRKVPPGLGGGITGALGGGPNPNLGPNVTSSNPNTGPAQQKNPEWIIGLKDFERRWQTVKRNLSSVRPGDTGNEPGYVLERFKAGMNVIHEVSLDDAINAPEMHTRIRAGIEYLIPEIWTDNRIFKGFFDPKFNAGFFTPEDLAKIIYLPESYRNISSFTKGQKRDVMRIRRMLLHALHPDLVKSDADLKLQEAIDILLKQLNSDWPLINKLIS